MGGVVQVACQGFLVREACVGVLVDGAGFLLSLLFKWVYLSFSPLLFTSLLSQLFVRPPQTAILLFSFLFLGDGLDHCLCYNVTNLHS